MKINTKIGKKGIIIPQELLQSVGVEEQATMIGMESVIVLQNTKMTALDIINAIEGLESVLETMYEVLLERCSKCDDCASCGYCEGIGREDIPVPDWAMEEAGLKIGTKMDIFVEEDRGIITLQEADTRYDITDVPDDIRAFLSAADICIGELNESIELEEIIYEQ